MSIANIPEIINDFNVYKGGSKLIGVSDEASGFRGNDRNHFGRRHCR